MKTNKGINSIESEFQDLWHYKVSDVPILKADYLTSEYFAERIAEPFELYEKYIRAIDYEKRICMISVDTPTKEFPYLLSDKDFDILHEEQPDVKFKRFTGIYDEEMKMQIEKYIEDMGFGGLRCEEHFREPDPDYRYTPYIREIYRQEHTLGFYLKRVGLLRGCFKNEFNADDKFEKSIFGDLNSFVEIGYSFNKDFVEYQYGKSAWKKVENNYQKNFIGSFEYGVSLLFKDSGYNEH